ncbi:hypothetical protein NEF87_004587 [Candidatus Lokiarchaeum ossiferum]|uniref:Metallo-beta-lactamase domain-containing protein n=1 Tax=Candidatus Lokiarchaeum ossiferum TaxID=2951803 RepID=A0ABY6HXQ9_9ARCH|nr:hypothetical protein NEF87_004587 [Candidatus Lokiarchaeum sp. B-35]
MSDAIQVEKLSIIEIPFKAVNCYLLRSPLGFILIDTGTTKNRHELETQLNRHGITPQNKTLLLIILTHGDFDHSGNAAYLKTRYNVPVALHYADFGMVEKGDITWNRNMNPFLKVIAKGLTMVLGLRLKKQDRFTPEITLLEGQQLTEYGVEGEIIELPGHSKGSIGILLKNQSLICGDVFQNRSTPELADMVADKTAIEESVAKIQKRNPKVVFPGHGSRFNWENFKG